MKIYLAGPMSGLPEHNYPAFHAAAARIRSKGHDVTNPAEVNPESAAAIGDRPTPRDWWIACMRRDLPQMLLCDALAVLPGWDKSQGARLEVYLAARLAMPIIDESTWKTLPPGSTERAIIIQEFLRTPLPIETVT